MYYSNFWGVDRKNPESVLITRHLVRDLVLSHAKVLNKTSPILVHKTVWFLDLGSLVVIGRFCDMCGQVVSFVVPLVGC